MRIFKSPRTVILILLDIAVLSGVFGTIVALNTIVHGPRNDPFALSMNYLLSVVLFFAVRIMLGVYSNVWRYANTVAYFKMVLADASAGIVTVLLTLIFKRIWYGAWETVSLFAVTCVVTLFSRFAYQLLHRRRASCSGSAETERTKSEKIKVAIIGAGQTGAMLAEELQNSAYSKYKPVAFIDSDTAKVGGTVDGIRVYSSKDDVSGILERHAVDEVIIALPGKQGDEQKAIIDFYDKLGKKVKIYGFPIGSTGEGSNKRVIREISIEDLLFRERIDILDTAAAQFYKGKTVLVTGGGGSIGSELCRQIAKCAPKKLVIVDIYENNAYDIQQELTREYGASLDLAVEIASVRDKKRLDTVFAYYKPEIVFHAAAHKHVPLMEHSNAEAIKNNIFGTRNAADVAEKHGVQKFILISTDKAVNPTNVMGASKRMCEMVVGCRKDSDTSFAAVRFGNVLGSNGSVVPLFKRQISEGGPVTVTDKRVVRYFMTIPEAAGLVMEAGAMAKRGTLFVLDMGKPVKIISLAETMIRLSGFAPYQDIDIKEIGLRPGEKLYEELLMKCEDLTKTENDLIFIEEDVPMTRSEVDEKLMMLSEILLKEEGKIASPEITEALKRAVPTFRSPDEINRTAEKAEEMITAKG